LAYGSGGWDIEHARAFRCLVHWCKVEGEDKVRERAILDFTINLLL
jgi:hypothetical protein